MKNRAANLRSLVEALWSKSEGNRKEYRYLSMRAMSSSARRVLSDVGNSVGVSDVGLGLEEG